MKYALLITGLITSTLAGCDQAGAPATNTSSVSGDTTRRASNSEPAASDATTVKRDNTKVNVRDRSEAAKTPLDQNENQTDINITADIRRQVTATQMSVNAQNVKIITQAGKVTLRGPVASVEEKSQVEKLAQDVAGSTNVVSELEVQP